MALNFAVFICNIVIISIHIYIRLKKYARLLKKYYFGLVLSVFASIFILFLRFFAFGIVLILFLLIFAYYFDNMRKKVSGRIANLISGRIANLALHNTIPYAVPCIA